MANKNKKRLHIGWIIFFITAGLSAFGFYLSRLMQGKNIALFHPKGTIAQQQYELMMFTIIVLLVVAIPVIFIAYSVAYKYRETNPKLKNTTGHSAGKSLDLRIWLLPTAIMLILASVMIPATHKLAPQKAIESDKKSITIQVISLRWKWLFLYPEQGIATVNFVQMPVDTPVEFEMTADEIPMSSFWIPNLGGQLYTMTSHVNRLNLMAEEIGDYPGSTPEINGKGFAGMKFTARASTEQDFDTWVQKVKQEPQILDSEAYASLLEPSENNPAAFYSSFEPGLYDKVIMKYSGSMEGHHE